MASQHDIQSLLRFLSQDAKVPLAQALGKVKELQGENLITPSSIANAEFDRLKNVFGDDKVARQVLNAAKRVSKKRSSTDAALPAASPKKAKSSYGQPLNPTEFEDSLALPEAELDESKLKDTVVYTNRAPLVLAFAVTLLKYTMPEQPLSSRLSLAQAVVSINSRSKAVHIGLESGKSAEEEGWGEGQPMVKVMGRQIRVMKRWGYVIDEREGDDSTQDTLEADTSSQQEPALWGVDLEVLKKANDPKHTAPGSRQTSMNQLPIYTAQSARAYLLKSFETPKSEDEPKSSAKKSNAAIVAERARNLGLLLGTLELLYRSWSGILSKEDLDRRAWGWYVNVRPEVKSGAAGWGGKGDVKLSNILDLRRPLG